MFEDDDESTDARTSQFTIRTPAMAKAFFIIAAAALIMAAIFNFTMAGYRSTLIAERVTQKAEEESRRTARQEQQRQAQLAKQRLAQARPQPFPATGSIQWKQIYPAGTPIRLLTISDQTGDGLNKIIRIEDQASQIHIANLYLQANTQASVALPVTSYRLLLSEGSQWLGPELNFGPQVPSQEVARVNMEREYNLELRFAKK